MENLVEVLIHNFHQETTLENGTVSRAKEKA
jgi:hypothetical protein